MEPVASIGEAAASAIREMISRVRSSSEVLDERRLLAVLRGGAADARHRLRAVVVVFVLARGLSGAGCASAAGGNCAPELGLAVSSLSLPVTDSLNSRMPLPSERPISGSRFGPKISRTTTRRIREPWKYRSAGMGKA